jgi:SAM-dependent methyltransferase
MARQHRGVAHCARCDSEPRSPGERLCLELRELIGVPETKWFENPSGAPLYPYLPATAHESVLDLGSGCGQVARQVMQQRTRPSRYRGVNLHRGMVAWCERNLSPRA